MGTSLGSQRWYTFCLFFCLHASLVSSDRTIASPKATDWGVWGKWEYCPPDMFVTGMQLRTQKERGFFGDDRGLTGIRLFCNPHEGTKNTTHAIQSLVDTAGDWGKNYFCQGFMTGFELRSEPYRGLFIDDTAGNNIRMFCEGSAYQYHAGDGTSFGQWTDKQLCGVNEAVCGLSTQIDLKDSWDQTGLNNVIMKCCFLPHPLRKCTPSTTWEHIATCVNSEGQKLKNCTYSRRIGVSYTDVGKDTKLFFEKQGMGLQEVIRKFQYKFMNITENAFSQMKDREDSVENYWQFSPPYIWAPQTSFLAKTYARSGTKVGLYQIRGKCGILQVWGTKLKRIEMDLATRKSKLIGYFDFTNEVEYDFI